MIYRFVNLPQDPALVEYIVVDGGNTWQKVIIVARQDAGPADTRRWADSSYVGDAVDYHVAGVLRIMLRDVVGADMQDHSLVVVCC